VYEIPTAGRALVAGGAKNGATKNGDTMIDPNAALLNAILEHAGARTALLAMGNPYLAQDFPSVQNYLCTFSNATVSEVAAVKALFGEIPTRGHLPVTIPGIASRGAGLERPGLNLSGGSSHVQ